MNQAHPCWRRRAQVPSLTLSWEGGKGPGQEHQGCGGPWAEMGSDPVEVPPEKGYREEWDDSEHFPVPRAPHSSQLSIIWISSSSFQASFVEAGQSCSEHGLPHLYLPAQQCPPGPSGVVQRDCGAWGRHEELEDLHRDNLGHIWSFWRRGQGSPISQLASGVHHLHPHHTVQ